KSFWQKPEGKTGMVFAAGALGALGVVLYKLLPYLVSIAQNTLYLVGLLMALGAIIYMILDPKVRNLVYYLYKSVMRWITGLFVQIDPIGILQTYIEELKDNLKKMDNQIALLRAQMRKLKDIMDENARAIQNNLSLASKAKSTDKDALMILKTR